LELKCYALTYGTPEQSLKLRNIQEVPMACSICNSNQIRSINGNIYVGTSIKFVTHPTFGCEIIVCENCALMEVDYLHPAIVSEFYQKGGAVRSITENARGKEIDKIVSQGQATLWHHLFSREDARVLFLSAGRGQYGYSFKTELNSVYVCDLLPISESSIKPSADVKFVSEAELIASDLAGTFDVIIISNTLERLPNPKHHLSWCSHVLKEGGVLAFEVPQMDIDLAQNAEFDVEEINFFSPQVIGNLVTIQGSFDILDSQLGQHPDGRGSMRIILQNQRRTAIPPVNEVEAAVLMDTLGKLSFACFSHSLKVARVLQAEPP